ncbi:YbhQ family protein, partial [Escherichia coli]
MPDQTQQFSFKVLTINIHKGFTAFNRRFILPELRDAVRTVSADIVCLQEVMMLVFQRHPEQRWREVADVLEELTTTWYFGAALIVLWL